MSWVAEVKAAYETPDWVRAPDPFDTPATPRQSVFRDRVAMPNFPTEDDLAMWVLDQLAPSFHIEREVWGTHCTGQRLRIDAVLRPRNTTDWADGDNAAVGVEFKLRAGGKTTTKWISQCFDYSHTQWDTYGRLGIFACPDVRMGWGEDADKAIGHLLGQIRIGELIQHCRYGLALVLHSHHRQWSQVRGVEEARRTHLRPTFGSR